MERNGLAQETDSWRSHVNVVKTFGFPKIRGITQPGKDLLNSQKGLLLHAVI